MTLSRMRRWSRVVALAVMFATVRLPHAGLDDAACAPTANGAYAPHSETEHRIRSATPVSADHCAICHFTRSTRPSRPQVAASASHRPILELLAGEASPTPLSATIAQLPARAPPVRL